MSIKKGLVFGTLVTGEKGEGTYSGYQSPTTGSYLVESVKAEDGRYADFAWFKEIHV